MTTEIPAPPPSIAATETDPYKRHPVAGRCKCDQHEVPAGCDGVQWYWSRHTRVACTLELPNLKCWCGRLRSEHIDGHDETAPRPHAAAPSTAPATGETPRVDRIAEDSRFTPAAMLALAQ
jgi:hypothetical protein